MKRNEMSNFPIYENTNGRDYFRHNEEIFCFDCVHFVWGQSL